MMSSFILVFFHCAVLPSFSGNVPAALKDIFPSANITRLGEWYSLLLIFDLTLFFFTYFSFLFVWFGQVLLVLSSTCLVHKVESYKQPICINHLLEPVFLPPGTPQRKQ